MTVYIDDMWRYPMGEYRHPLGVRTMKMSHMIADTTAELLAMAATIGVQAKWIQKAGTPGEHFDVAKGHRAKAVKAGAVEITLRQCSFMTSRRTRAGILGKPEDAEAWWLANREPANRELLDWEIEALGPMSRRGDA